MALDFQQVREQVLHLGNEAHQDEARLAELYEVANHLILKIYANDLEAIRQRVLRLVHNNDPFLRCALPVHEPLSAHFAAPSMPKELTIIAADGSQILPDRHAQVEYCLINVGAVQIRRGSPEPAKTHITSQLLYGPEIETPFGLITEATLALRRDLWERKILAQMASQALSPLVTFTDGPIELYAGRVQDGTELSEFQKALGDYLGELNKLCEMGVITAGYIDKPRGALVVRLLELLILSDKELQERPRPRPLNGVRDIYLIEDFLEPGERSAVFALQSASTRTYAGSLGLHFFYINIGRPGHPYLARVEIPAWVAEEPELLNTLHAALVQQCGILGAQPYPYLLHRAHEVARVTQQEKEQVTQMVAQELLSRGINPRGKSAKQFAKDGWSKRGYK